MVSVTCAECHFVSVTYTECHVKALNVDCCYAECSGALFASSFIKQLQMVQHANRSIHKESLGLDKIQA